MCGIIYVKKRKVNDNDKKIKYMGDTVDELKKAYQEQKSRGKEGFGYVSIKDGKVTYDRSADEKEIEKSLDGLDAPDEILFHHRYPTSTKNIAECAHPIMVDNKELDNIFYVVHNGVITNTASLKEKHEKLGYVYNTEVTIRKTELTETITRIPHPIEKGMVIGYNNENKTERTEHNDSESLAIELARLVSDKGTDIGTHGSVAFMMLEVDRTGRPLRMHFGRNGGNPLGKRKKNGHIIVSSLGGDDIEDNTWYAYDYETGAEVSEKMKIGNYYDYKKDYSKDNKSTAVSAYTGHNMHNTSTIHNTRDDDAGETYGDEYWQRKYGLKHIGSPGYGGQRKLEWDKDDDTRARITTEEKNKKDPIDLSKDDDYEMYQAQQDIFDEYIKRVDDIDREITNCIRSQDPDLATEWESVREQLTADCREVLGDEFDTFMDWKLEEEMESIADENMVDMKF